MTKVFTLFLTKTYNLQTHFQTIQTMENKSILWGVLGLALVAVLLSQGGNSAKKDEDYYAIKGL